MKRREKYKMCEVVEFVKLSYWFVDPKGIWQHVRFVVDLPGAAFRFFRFMKEKTR